MPLFFAMVKSKAACKQLFTIQAKVRPVSRYLLKNGLKSTLSNSRFFACFITKKSSEAQLSPSSSTPDSVHSLIRLRNLPDPVHPSSSMFLDVSITSFSPKTITSSVGVAYGFLVVAIRFYSFPPDPYQKKCRSSRAYHFSFSVLP